MTKRHALVEIEGGVAEKESLYQRLDTLAQKYKLYIICDGGSEEKSEEKRVSVENELRRRGIPASVFSPAIKFGDKICHMNGDHVVMMVCHNFSKAFIVTSTGTNKDSLKFIKGIEIIEL